MRGREPLRAGGAGRAIFRICLTTAAVRRILADWKGWVDEAAFQGEPKYSITCES